MRPDPSTKLLVQLPNYVGIGILDMVCLGEALISVGEDHGI